MQHKESTFTGYNNLELYYQSWHPDTAPKATLIIVHGLGEHGGRYMNLVNPLTAAGYAVYACDNRGHGRTPGKQGYINSFDEFRQDVIVFQVLVREQEGELPLFIMGHSLGGLITLYTILHDSSGYTGTIISAPALDTGGVSTVLMAASKILSRLKPDLSIPTGLDATGISRDSAVVDAYQNDPLVHGVGTPRLAVESPAAMTWCEEHATDLQIPILMIHGTDDRLTSPTASRAFFDKLTVEDKTYISYDGGYHESLNDIHHQQAAADIQNWLDSHL
jgi:alpha-beta hydrolase superfamily lysophospholipase